MKRKTNKNASKISFYTAKLNYAISINDTKLIQELRNHIVCLGGRI